MCSCCGSGAGGGSWNWIRGGGRERDDVGGEGELVREVSFDWLPAPLARGLASRLEALSLLLTVQNPQIADEGQPAERGAFHTLLAGQRP